MERSERINAFKSVLGSAKPLPKKIDMPGLMCASAFFVIGFDIVNKEWDHGLIEEIGLDPAEVEAYVASGEWRDKAGGYAIQGRAEGFTLAINGSYSNVVGLPLAATLNLLRGLGWRAAP